MSIRLHDIAHCRAGDKGNTSTLSVIAYDEASYPLLCRALTAELLEVRPEAAHTTVRTRVTMRAAHADKPCCVADCVSRFVP